MEKWRCVKSVNLESEKEISPSCVKRDLKGLCGPAILVCIAARMCISHDSVTV
jgi:hypothetical protein